MKQIPQSTTSGTWNSALISQLGYIRKYLRYPISRRTLLPLQGITAFLPILILIGYTLFTRTDKSNGFLYVLPLVMALPVIVGIIRYFRTLRFRVVQAYPSLSDNIRLIQEFLEANHFAFGQHPEAPEVFQMVSRNLGHRHEIREVLIFIADDNRILLNSHFDSERRQLPFSIGKSKEMARMLEKWLETQPVENDSTELRKF